MGGTLLALIIALGSFAIYFSAFFFPEVHRKSDFYWSGLGFFYALVLWICSGRITGAVLLGQTASVALLVWFGTQTLILRRNLASPEEKTRISENVAASLKNLSPITLWQKIRGKQPQATQETATPKSETKPSEEAESSEETAETQSTPSPERESSEETTETQPRNSSENQTVEETTEATPSPSQQEEKGETKSE
ncbi:MAG: Ycf66 family protein [Halothece sp.]